VLITVISSATSIHASVASGRAGCAATARPVSLPLSLASQVDYWSVPASAARLAHLQAGPGRWSHYELRRLILWRADSDQQNFEDQWTVRRFRAIIFRIF